jgi:hypothetical protein
MSEVFSSRIQKGSRTYFFDIKLNERSEYYLTITESKKSGDNFERSRIMVFEEDIEDFADLFQNAFSEIKKRSKRS